MTIIILFLLLIEVFKARFFNVDDVASKRLHNDTSNMASYPSNFLIIVP